MALRSTNLELLVARRTIKKSPWRMTTVRNYRYNKKGGMKPGRNKIPLDWRKVDHNPAKIPSAWIPDKWKETTVVDYDHEQRIAQYVPGYIPKVKEEEDPFYNVEPLHQFSADTKLVEGLKQALCLTKSVLFEELPQPIQKLSKEASVSYQDDLAIQIFRHAFLFDVDPKNLDKQNKTKRFMQDNFRLYPTQKRSCSLILDNMIRLCQSHVATLPGYLHKVICNDVETSAVYRRVSDLNYESASDLEKNWLVSIRFSGGHHVLSQRPLKVFADESEVHQTKLKFLPDIFPVFPIVDLKKTHLYKPLTSTGLLKGFTHPHLHTLFIMNLNEFSPEEMYAQMILQLFACLFSRANEQYGSSPMDLPYPLAGQVVALDGRNYQFMCMQLNTTKLDCDDGVKNMVWIDNRQAGTSATGSYAALPMFETCSHREWHRPEYYTGYASNVMRTLMAFWLNSAQ